MSFSSVCVVGAGRVGQAIAARLQERVPTRTTGRDLSCDGSDLVLICVPDQEISNVAPTVPSGPWIAHVSGGTSLHALDPHEKRFSVHPLQTFQHGLGPEQLDGAWAAVTGETDDAIRAGLELAGLLGLEPFELADEERPIYHAGATVAASFLVTLHDVAAELLRAAGAPPEALRPLMQRTIENGFAPTGPHVRSDWETIDRHLETIRERRPELEPVYRALSEATSELLTR